MKVLEYSGLDTSRVSEQYAKIKRALERDDLRSADLKKLSGSEFYRAKLDRSNRLLVKLVRHQGARYAIALEVIEQHAYDRSAFLQGAAVDEDKVEAPVAAAELDRDVLPEIAYLNPASSRVHVLDKVLSFDDAQEAVYRAPPPVILIGSAGSGKTALALEKLKLATGSVLYVTRSAYLTQHARNLYYANGYVAEHQAAEFLNLAELVGTIAVPAGREVRFADFRAWFGRQRQAARRVRDAHALFEEFRGVLTGTSLSVPWLSREDYLSLGVRRSIFLDEEREEVYGLFEKYLAWLRDTGLYDANIVAQQRLDRVTPRYNFLVADETQDLTNVELTLILKTLERPGEFLLCGDSNQIVHPNFFSWANVKTLFFEHEELAPWREIFVLRANYRNAVEVTDIANRLLKTKLARFGAVDRESHYLVESLPSMRGEVELLSARDATVNELDAKTRRSRRFAVIVLRDEDKVEAAKRFHTPLLFSVQEAKGLEYENVILYNMVTEARDAFAQVAENITAADLEGEPKYARAADKRDKSLETYKFFVNALYVAMTRAVRRLYVVEADIGHPLLRLIGLSQAREQVDLATQTSNVEEWQEEARRLELQGKHEQADAVRRDILRVKQVPWQVLNVDRFIEAAAKGLDPRSVSSKLRQQLLEYAAVYQEYDVADRLIALRFTTVDGFAKQEQGMRRKHLASYEPKNPSEVMRLVGAHGVDFRSPVNLTPLMLAALAGNVNLVRVLIERGAEPALVDNVGRTALHVALARARIDERYASEVLPSLWRHLAPESTSLVLDGRLVKLDAHQIEYLLFHEMYTLLRAYLCMPGGWRGQGMRSGDLLDAVARLPIAALRGERRRRQYLSGVLARNEVTREYAYNRRLFVRVAHGEYVLNPELAIRLGDDWVNVYAAMGIARMAAQGFGRHVRALEMIERARALQAYRRGVAKPLGDGEIAAQTDVEDALADCDQEPRRAQAQLDLWHGD
jgi:hypothetical protein